MRDMNSSFESEINNESSNEDNYYNDFGSLTAEVKPIRIINAAESVKSLL